MGKKEDELKRATFPPTRGYRGVSGLLPGESPGKFQAWRNGQIAGAPVAAPKVNPLGTPVQTKPQPRQGNGPKSVGEGIGRIARGSVLAAEAARKLAGKGLDKVAEFGANIKEGYTGVAPPNRQPVAAATTAPARPLGKSPVQPGAQAQAPVAPLANRLPLDWTGPTASFDVTREGGVQVIRTKPGSFDDPNKWVTPAYVDVPQITEDVTYDRKGRLASSGPNSASVAANSAANIANAGGGKARQIPGKGRNETMTPAQAATLQQNAMQIMLDAQQEERQSKATGFKNLTEGLEQGQIANMVRLRPYVKDLPEEDQAAWLLQTSKMVQPLEWYVDQAKKNSGSTFRFGGDTEEESYAKGQAAWDDAIKKAGGFAQGGMIQDQPYAPQGYELGGNAEPKPYAPRPVAAPTPAAGSEEAYLNKPPVKKQPDPARAQVGIGAAPVQPPAAPVAEAAPEQATVDAGTQLSDYGPPAGLFNFSTKPVPTKQQELPPVEVNLPGPDYGPPPEAPRRSPVAQRLEAPMPEPRQTQPGFTDMGPPLYAYGVGGSVDDYRQGGPVAGGPPGTDTVPAMLNNGEYVLPPPTMQAMGGKDALDQAVLATTGTPPVGYAEGGGVVGAYNTLKNRGNAIDAAVSGAVNSAPAPVAPPPVEQVAAPPAVALPPESKFQTLLRAMTGKPREYPPPQYGCGGLVKHR